MIPPVYQIFLSGNIFSIADCASVIVLSLQSCATALKMQASTKPANLIDYNNERVGMSTLLPFPA
jgi:hypothetical protein